MRIAKSTSPISFQALLSHLIAFAFLAGSACTAQDLGLSDAAPGSIGAEVAAGATPDQTSRYPEIKAAFEKFTKQQFKDAEDQLKTICKGNPELPPAGIILGTWHFNAKQAGFARAAFERAVRDNPEDPEAFVVFGDNAVRQRRFTDGILLYEKALKTISNYNANATRKKNLTIRAYGGAAAVYETREDWQKAEAALNKVLELDSENVVAMTRMGHVLFRQDREQDAYEAFKKVYETDPEKMVRYEVNMARLYQATDKGANAEKLYLKALERDPQGLQTHLAVAQWGLETGRTDLVNRVADAALKIDPDAVQVLLLQGVLSRTDQDFSKAEVTLRKAHTEAPSNPVVLNQLALCVGSQDDPEKQKQALEFAQMATRMFPDNNQPFGREAKVTLAWLANKAGQKEQAVGLLTQALRAGPVGPEPAYYAADIFNDNGKPEVARQMLESALKNAAGVFPARKLAEALLEKLKAAAPATTPAPAP